MRGTPSNARALPPPLGSHDCFTASYGLLLRHLGRDFRVLGDDWNFRYARDPGCEWPLYQLRTTTRTYPEVLRSWYGIEELELQHQDFETAWRHIQASTAGGRPVIVFTDALRLPYVRRRSGLRPHRIVVTDCRGDHAYVIDDRIERGGGVRVRARRIEFRGWVAVDDLRSAMSSPQLAVDLGYKAQNVTIELLDGGAPDRSMIDNAHASLRRFGASGTEALQALSADMERDVPLEPNGTLRPRRLEHGSMLFGELASQRRLNSQFLDLAAELTGLERLRDSRIRAERVADAWDAVRWMFLYVALRRPHALLRHLAVRLQQVAELENDLTAHIAAAQDLQDAASERS